MAPAGRDHVVLQLFEVRIAHFGKDVTCEIHRECTRAQLIVVRVVWMTGQIGVERQIDCLGEDVLESVITRDRDRESALVDRETVLVENAHSLEEVIVRATADDR